MNKSVISLLLLIICRHGGIFAMERSQPATPPSSPCIRSHSAPLPSLAVYTAVRGKSSLRSSSFSPLLLSSQENASYVEREYQLLLNSFHDLQNRPVADEHIIAELIDKRNGVAELRKWAQEREVDIEYKDKFTNLTKEINRHIKSIFPSSPTLMRKAKTL